MVLAAYPAWVRANSGGVLVPVTWAAECGLAAGLAAIGLAAAKGPWIVVERRLFRAALSSFAVSYILLIALGFDWTGDWLRFAGFRAGWQTEPALPGAGPADWRIYHWRSWGFAGLKNDAYLVSDPNGRLAALPDNGVLPGLACPIAQHRALVLPWHLITTANCVLTRASGPRLDI